MNSDIEDLLREGMDQITSDVRAPAGLMARIARRRRRRLVVRSMGGAAAALTAGAVAMAIVVLPGADHQAAAAAYVVKRVDRALSVAKPGDMARMTITATGPAGLATAGFTAQEWSYGSRWRLVTYASPGHPLSDSGDNGSSVYTMVNYTTRTWARDSDPGSALQPAPLTLGCVPKKAMPSFFGAKGVFSGVFSGGPRPVNVADALRAAISCGTLTVVGRQRIDGTEAIELTSDPKSFMSEAIWVSPGSYLPLRVVISLGLVRMTANITWLTPTAANLAMLTVPIPAAFREVPLAEAIELNLKTLYSTSAAGFAWVYLNGGMGPVAAGR
jgi:hypothetical protein